MALDPGDKVPVTGAAQLLVQGVTLGDAGRVTRVPAKAPRGGCGFRMAIVTLE